MFFAFSRPLHLLILFTLTLLSVGFSISTHAAVQEQAAELLNRMSKALREKNYQGRFMYVAGKDMSSFQIQHAVFDQKEYERLVFLNKKDQEVVRIGHELFCVHAGNHLLREHQDLSSNPMSQKSQKLENLSEIILPFYQINISENHIIAGRTTTLLSFIAKDNNRFNHHLWIDQQSALLLKSEVSDVEQEVLESFEFSHLEVDIEIPKSEFDHHEYVRHKAEHISPHFEAALTDSHWQTGWLPQGFSLSGVTQNQNKIDVMMYSDGLSAISIFIEAVDSPSGFNESSQQGAISAFSQAFKFEQQNYMITAVGDVPMHTLERLVKGVSYLKK